MFYESIGLDFVETEIPRNENFWNLEVIAAFLYLRLWLTGRVRLERTLPRRSVKKKLDYFTFTSLAGYSACRLSHTNGFVDVLREYVQLPERDSIRL